MKNYYDILGIAPTATKEEIKKAYRKLSVKFHPDKNEGEHFYAEMFRQINDAHQALTDDFSRANHDRKLKEYMTAKDRGQLIEELRSMNEKVKQERQEYLNQLKKQETKVSPTAQAKARTTSIPNYNHIWTASRNRKTVQRIMLAINILLAAYIVLMPAKRHLAAKAPFLGANGRVITKSGVNIREEPNTKGKVILAVPFGHYVKVIDNSMPFEVLDGKQNRWYKVEYTHGNIYRLGYTPIIGWVWGGMVEDL